MPERLRERKKARTRESLADVAIGLFGERGIEATSMDDIAAAAGVSRATVFNHFPYKESLLVEIGARFVAGIAEHAAAHRRRSPRLALYDLADGVASIAEHYPGVVAYIAREMTHPEPARRGYAIERMGYPALYESLLSELAAAGGLRSKARVRTYGRQLVDLTTGALVRAGNDIPLEELQAELRANVDLFCDGALTEGSDR